jgi:hypothetical protein
MAFKVELITFYDWWAEIDFTETYEYLGDARVSAEACFNRMTDPTLGVWQITITDLLTGERIPADNKSPVIPPA